MKLTKFRTHNQKGFVHHVIPLVTFVALFAIIGGYFIFRSYAATATYYIEPTEATGYCLSDVSGIARLETCTSSGTKATIVASGGDHLIEINGDCLQNNLKASPLGLHFGACAELNTSQYWIVAGKLPFTSSTIESNADSPQCVSGSSLGSQLTLASCSAASYKTWKTVTVSSAPAPSPPPTTTGSGGSSSGGVNLSATPTSCYSKLYTTANESSVINCVGALQTMLNGMRTYDKGSTLTVDGQYGPLTAAQVKVFQKYAKISQDGEAGTQTWSHLCSDIKSKGLSTGSSSNAKAYKYAECSKS